LPVFDAIIGLVVGGGSLLLLDRIAVMFLGKRGMGMGDVKLLAMLGAFFGWPAVIMIIMISSLLGSIVGIAAVVWAKRQAKSGVAGEPTSGDEDITLEGHYLPFGPYLCLAGLIIIFFGEQLYNGYLQYMGLAGS
jgi:leader peptidase (prepilin peptidase)/N-methyltransferase